MSEASNNDAEPRVSVKIVDMENRKALYAQQICRELILSGRGNEKAVAAQLKRDFDDAFGGTWHCIVGASFGGNVTHRENHFLYFFVENFAVMLFKSA
uniref:Dynein light chain n=1 Tax=Panagrellus redivivus TaxID=6233 RepID=A0A7E4VVB5_PANRE